MGNWKIENDLSIFKTDLFVAPLETELLMLTRPMEYCKQTT